MALPLALAAAALAAPGDANADPKPKPAAAESTAAGAKPSAGAAKANAGAGKSAANPNAKPGTAGKPATKPTTKPIDPLTQRKIEELETYYAKLYGEPLNLTDRLPRMIAIVSLARIDCDETTQRLLDVFKGKDKDPVIWYLAWEALHSRVGSLDADQRQRWATGGLAAGNLGGFPGPTVAPLLRALAEHHPVVFEAEPAKLAIRTINENELSDPAGKRALDALRHLIAAWHDPVMIRLVSAQMQRPQVADRVLHVLGGLPDAPAETDPRKAGGLWSGWLSRNSGMKAAAASELKPYQGDGKVFAVPEQITDPDDPKWRAELEIGKVTVSDFDLVWCIDSTGSMFDENQMVAAQTGNVIRLCSLVSRRARCGTIYFRHETVPALMQECCKKAAANPRWYQVRGFPLTAEVSELSGKMAAEPIPKPDAENLGNVHPGGAYAGALMAAMKEMKWSDAPNSARVIVLVGDSKLTPGTEKACEELSAIAAKEGYQLHALVKGEAVQNWAAAVKAGNGSLLLFDGPGGGAAAKPKPAAKPPAKPAAGNPGGGGNAPGAGNAPRANEFEEIAVRVVRGAVGPAYRDRVNPLLDVLLPYARELGEAEQRTRGTMGGR